MEEKIHFRVIPQSNVQLAESFSSYFLDIANSTINLHAKETKKFAVLDWVENLVYGLDSEIITILNLDENGKISCMLRFIEIALVSHEFDAQKSEHQLEIRFKSMERVKNPPKIG